MAGGFLSPSDAVAAAKEVGAKTIAFADRGDMAGYCEWMEACKEQNVSVVPGIEAMLEFEGKPYIFQFYAAGKEGLSDLLKLVSKMSPTSTPGSLPLVLPESLNKNIIVLSPGATGGATEFILKKDGVGLSRLNDFIRNQGARFGIGLDPETTEPSYHFLFKDYTSIVPYRPAVFREGDDFVFRDTCRYCFNSDPIENLQYEIPTIKTASEWARISLEKQNLTFDLRYINGFEKEFSISPKEIPTPHFSPDIAYRGLNPESASEELTKLCNDNLRLLFARSEKVNPAFDKAAQEKRVSLYQKRIEEEIDLIKKTNLSTRILALSEISSKFWTTLSPAVRARGSATNSLVCFLSGLTEINSHFHDIPYERFLNPNRSTAPDIDIDVSLEVGPQFRAEIGKLIPYSTSLRQFTHSTIIELLPKILSKHSIKESKTRDITEKTGLILDQIDPNARKMSFSTLESLDPNFRQQFLALGEPGQLDSVAADLIATGRRPIRSTPHVGMALAASPIEFELPVITMDSTTGPVLAIPQDQADKYGLVKVDILTNTHFDFLKCADQILRKGGSKSIVGNQLQRPAYYQSILQKGRTAGIYQFSDKDDLLRRVRPENFDELANANALIRLSGQSGPESAVDRYIASAKSPQMPAAIVKLPLQVRNDYAQITEKTRGVVIYQEQLTRLLHSASGLPLSECEDLRRSMAKKSASLGDLHKKASSAISSHCNVSNETAEEVFGLFLQEGNYLFNKGHAYAYAMIALREVAIKYDHTAEFFVAKVHAWRTGVSKESPKDFKTAQSRLTYDCVQLGVNVTPLDFSQGLWTQSAGKKVSRAGCDRPTRSHVLLGIDAIPSFSQRDLIKVASAKFQNTSKNPLTPEDLLKEGVSKDAVFKCIHLGAFNYLGKSPQELIRRTGEENSLAPIPDQRSAYLDTFGFYPPAIHPGLALKSDGDRRTISAGNLLADNSFAPGEIVSVSGFLMGAPTRKDTKDFCRISFSICSRIGDPGVQISVIYREKEKADSLNSDLTALVTSYKDKPITLDVEKTISRKNGKTYWNIVSEKVKLASNDSVIPLSTLIDKEAQKFKQIPPVTDPIPCKSQPVKNLVG